MLSLREVTRENWRATLELAVFPDQQRFIQFIRDHYPQCQVIQLTVHPENEPAKQLYSGAGFLPTGSELMGEPVDKLSLMTEKK